jgi:hypothetical protein
MAFHGFDTDWRMGDKDIRVDGQLKRSPSWRGGTRGVEHEEDYAAAKGEVMLDAWVLIVERQRAWLGIHQ